METQTSKMQELRAKLNKIFTEDFNDKTSWTDTQLKKLKINTNETLSSGQLSELEKIADEKEMEYYISRSGSGLKIEFDLK
tara:strand:+ start:556 stop:798 length:243 start_codon:yes stop_codon:yes gene_type:complete